MPTLPKLTAVLLGVAAAPGLPREARAQQLDVMSYNVRYATAPDGANAWPNRKAMLIEPAFDERTLDEEPWPEGPASLSDQS